MEGSQNGTSVPLRMLVETIIEKKSISAEEQQKVNSLATGTRSFNPEDFEAISKLTELICAGEVQVEAQAS